MKRLVRRLLVLSLLVGGTAQAATLTVSPGQSIKEALAKMGSGDTLVIKAGTYREGGLKPPSGTTVKAETAGTVIIAPNNQSVDTIFEFQGSTTNVVLDGLILDGNKQTAFPLYSAPESSNLTFQNGVVRQGRQSGGLLGGTRWTIRNSQILDNGLNCCGTHSDDHGLYFQASYSLIVGNMFSGGACYNMQIYGGPNPTDNTIEGNLFTKSKCGVTMTHGKNHVFKNNISVEDGGYYGPDGVLVFTPGTTLIGNTVVRRNMITVQGGDVASVKFVQNQLCEGKIITTNATQSGNTVSCQNLPDLTKPPGATGPTLPPVIEPPPVVIEPPPAVTEPSAPVVLGAPRNVRVKAL